MLRIPCKSCQKTLDLDDAFAGGVCRCMHCGAIQKVPRSTPKIAPDTPPPATEAPDEPRNKLAILLLALAGLAVGLLAGYWFAR